MLRFWLSRDASIPIREQLSAQLLLGSSAGDLPPESGSPALGTWPGGSIFTPIPSVPRTRIWLHAGGWPSGPAAAYLCAPTNKEPDGAIEAFARACVEDGLARGFKREDMLAAFAAVPQAEAIRRLVVIDPDIEFARILAAEIGESTGWAVTFHGLDNLPVPGADTCVLVNSARASTVIALLGQTTFRCIELKSMQDVVAGYQRPAAPVLIGVVSHSESILHWAGTLLSALGFPTEAVIYRDARQPGWTDGLGACDIVATDMVTAAELPSHQPVVFRIISEQFLAELGDFLQTSL